MMGEYVGGAGRLFLELVGFVPFLHIRLGERAIGLSSAVLV